jgi:antitoxin (DNA-binding transcriptional repressor) of toxin-antitoxin stability system
MKPVTVHAAKTHLSRLIARACAGEDVVIARGKTPVVRLVPVAAGAMPGKARVPGALKGLIKLDDAFFEPLPEEELALWEGRHKNLGGMETPPLRSARRKGR